MKKKNNIEYLQLNNAENSEDFDIEHKKSFRVQYGN